jgi:hypothetical protein
LAVWEHAGVDCIEHFCVRSAGGAGGQVAVDGDVLVRGGEGVGNQVIAGVGKRYLRER